MVAPTSVVQRLVILHNFFDALCLMWQNLHPTHTETLTIKVFCGTFFQKSSFMNSFILFNASVICSTEYAYEILA